MPGHPHSLVTSNSSNNSGSSIIRNASLAAPLRICLDQIIQQAHLLMKGAENRIWQPISGVTNDDGNCNMNEIRRPWRRGSNPRADFWWTRKHYTIRPESRSLWLIQNNFRASTWDLSRPRLPTLTTSRCIATLCAEKSLLHLLHRWLAIAEGLNTILYYYVYPMLAGQ